MSNNNKKVEEKMENKRNSKNKVAERGKQIHQEKKGRRNVEVKEYYRRPRKSPSFPANSRTSNTSTMTG